jgi:hypothetical protein
LAFGGRGGKMAGMTTQHCWHRIGTAMVACETTYQMVCCHCGARSTQVTAQCKPAGHGRYAPLESYLREVDDQSDCPKNPLASEARLP